MDFFWHAIIQICATDQRVGLLRAKHIVRQGYIIYIPGVCLVLELWGIFVHFYPLYKVLNNERDWVWRREGTGSWTSVCKFKSQVKRLRSIVPSIHTMAEWYNVVVMFKRYVIVNLLVYTACIDSGQRGWGTVRYAESCKRHGKVCVQCVELEAGKELVPFIWWCSQYFSRTG